MSSNNRRYTLQIQLDPHYDNSAIKEYYMSLPKMVLEKEDSGVDIMVANNIICAHHNIINIIKNINSDDNNNISENSNNITKINTHIKCCMIDNVHKRTTGYFLYPRSSIYKYNLSLANSTGIIDAGYRGHIMGMVYNNVFRPITLESGTRLFQICAPDLSPVSVEIVDALPSSERGEKGLGSSGL